MYDLKLSHASLRLSRPIRTGDIVNQEGLVLCSALEDGVEKAALYASAPGATVKVLGFSSLADALPTQTSAIESVTVPTAPAGLVVGASKTNLIQNFIRVYRVDNAQVLTPDYTYAGNTGANTVKIDVAKGLFKFHANESAKNIIITYLYELTSLQAKQQFGERHINNRGLHTDYSAFGQMEVLTGIGEIWTDAFDPTQDYTSSAALTVGANGLISKGGSAVIPAVVVGVPSVGVGSLLGVRFVLTA